ncbi:CpsD/CapB family tyrosine-protein kinase [Mycoplasmatota bacterium]|nr:CpsD/CapB family tyrosine-protein kinase [Mycoplasmatota bacterium]
MAKKQVAIDKLINGKQRVEKYDYLITKNEPLSFATESFQKIVIDLDYTNLDNDHKVLQFTSTLPSEGKSTFVSNIAYLLSQKNKKVILLDLDLRKPKINRAFSVPNKNGITDYISSKITLEEAIKTSEDLGIDFMVAGENTSLVTNVLESNKMKELIDSLRERYDYVLLDTPPVMAVSDAIVVSRYTDGIIFIIAQGKAKKKLVKESIQTLKRYDVNILGIVFNQVKMGQAGYGYMNDYSYYQDKND